MIEHQSPQMFTSGFSFPDVAADPAMIGSSGDVSIAPVGTGSGYYGQGLTAPAGLTLDGGTQGLQDGSVLASGWSTDGTNTPVLVDYNADGSVNTAFGNNGELSGPAGASWLSANQNADGSIQVQGSVTNPDGSNSSFLEQFTSSGLTDTAFGGGSGSLVAPAGVAFNGNFTVLTNGDILAGAVATDGTSTPSLVDYTAQGVLNQAFGTNGQIAAASGVTAENFYQDGVSGDIVIQDYTAQADGSLAAQTGYYTVTGQPDPNGAQLSGSGYYAPSLIAVDPIAVDPIVIDPTPVDGGTGWWNSGTTGTVTLLSEDFSNGSWQAGTSWENNGVTWNWQLVNGDVAPTEYEAYSAAGAPDRGMPATEGGFEVASSGNDGSLWAVTASITLPGGVDASQSATVTFDAGYRDQVTSGQFGIYDVTQGMDLLSPQQINGSVGTWTGNQFSVDLSQAAPGDVIELRWLDSAGNSWSGLEVGSVNFTAAPTSSGIDGLTAPVGVSLDGGTQSLQDGSVLASGWSSDGTGIPVLVDYNADGSINTAFGINGELNGPAGATDLWANQTDSGMIQLQGNIDNGDGTSSAFFAQYTAAGQLDTSFGGGTGFLAAPTGASFDGNFQTLADGSILASAITTDGNAFPVLVDYNADGTLNTSFGSNGVLSGPAGTTDFTFVQTASGAIQLQGNIGNGDGTSSAFFAQYTAAGQLDTSFGGGTGFLIAPTGASFDGNFQTLADGSILASAGTTDGNATPVLVDYNADGTLNSAFGQGGILFGPDGTDALWASDNGDGTFTVTADVQGGDGSSSLYSAQYSSTAGLIADFTPVSPSLDGVDLLSTNVAYDRFMTVSGSVSPVSVGVSETSSVGVVSGGTYTSADQSSALGTSFPAMSTPPSVSGESSGLGTVADLGNPVDVPSFMNGDGVGAGPGSLIVAPAFDPSVLGSGIAGISALKLAASETGDASRDDSSSDNPVLALQADVLPPSLSQDHSTGKPQTREDLSTEEMTTDTVDPSSRVASEEELIAALLEEA